MPPATNTRTTTTILTGDALAGVGPADREELPTVRQRESGVGAGELEGAPESEREREHQQEAGSVAGGGRERRARDRQSAEAGDAVAEDEYGVEDDVDGDGGDVDVQRRPGVAPAEEASLQRVREPHEQEDGRVGCEVRDGRFDRACVGIDRRDGADERVGEEEGEEGGRGTEQEREDDAVERGASSGSLLVRADALGDDDVRADHRADDGERDEDGGQRRHETDGSEFGLADAAEPEGVDHLLDDLDEVLDHERCRERDEHLRYGPRSYVVR